LRTGTKEFIVQKVEVRDAGSLHIALSEDLSLEVFPDNSITDEYWRLFEPGEKKPHFVVTGIGARTRDAAGTSGGSPG
jgi:hypothetical protein